MSELEQCRSRLGQCKSKRGQCKSRLEPNKSVLEPMFAPELEPKLETELELEPGLELELELDKSKLEVDMSRLVEYKSIAKQEAGKSSIRPEERRKRIVEYKMDIHMKGIHKKEELGVAQE